MAGVGASGWGRTHGEAGLLEMVQMKYIDVDRPGAARKALVVPLWRGFWSTPRTLFSQFEFSGGIGAKLRKRPQCHGKRFP